MKTSRYLFLFFFSVMLTFSTNLLAHTLICKEEKAVLSITLNADHSLAQIFQGNNPIPFGELVCQKNISDINDSYYLQCSSKGIIGAGYTAHFIVFNGIISAHISEIYKDGQLLIQSLPCQE